MRSPKEGGEECFRLHLSEWLSCCTCTWVNYKQQVRRSLAIQTFYFGVSRGQYGPPVLDSVRVARNNMNVSTS